MPSPPDTGIGKALASGRHSNDSLKVDISSMRQLVTEALEIAAKDIDSFRGLCKSKRQVNL
ncbi:hypothetical protein [Pseudomonas sp. R5(2019)]|uniref:hypothetical protein n=1 Tax=Pseudomonas sp. R5(2019) TaxID=2697566 RepID=UPI00141366B5|nr:hypothetical protein [Pseudomonas sp. R5(2019)]NBA95691.1 hypothetical protein [Pseudomonas sp. R5(2019)]